MNLQFSSISKILIKNAAKSCNQTVEEFIVTATLQGINHRNYRNKIVDRIG